MGEGETKVYKHAQSGIGTAREGEWLLVYQSQGMWVSVRTRGDSAKLNTSSETVAGVEPLSCVRGPELRRSRVRSLWERLIRARCGAQSRAEPRTGE